MSMPHYRQFVFFGWKTLKSTNCTRDLGPVVEIGLSIGELDISPFELGEQRMGQITQASIAHKPKPSTHLPTHSYSNIQNTCQVQAPLALIFHSVLVTQKSHRLVKFCRSFCNPWR